jgi:hypothetical protein
VSPAAPLSGERPQVQGQTRRGLEDYTEELVVDRGDGVAVVPAALLGP